MTDLRSMFVNITADALHQLMSDALELQKQQRANQELAEIGESQRRRIIDLLDEKELLRQELSRRSIRADWASYEVTAYEWADVIAGLPEVRRDGWEQWAVTAVDWLEIVRGTPEVRQEPRIGVRAWHRVLIGLKLDFGLENVFV